jgi:hypothetical protein
MHSLTIVPEDEFEKFKNCDLLLDYKVLVSAENEYKNVMDKLESYEDNMSDEYRETYKTELSFEKFKEVLRNLSYDDLCFYNREDAREDIKTHCGAVQAALDDDIFTLSTMGKGEYETFAQHYTTKSGDKIVAFGFYGGG